jgi:hypothetical protein
VDSSCPAPLIRQGLRRIIPSSTAVLRMALSSRYAFAVVTLLTPETSSLLRQFRTRASLISATAFKGAPPARHACGRNRLRELARAPRGEAAGRPVMSGKGRRALAVAGRQLSPRPSGQSPTARRAAAQGCPGTGRSRSPAATPRCRTTRAGPAVVLTPGAPIAV